VVPKVTPKKHKSKKQQSSSDDEGAGNDAGGYSDDSDAAKREPSDDEDDDDDGVKQPSGMKRKRGAGSAASSSRAAPPPAKRGKSQCLICTKNDKAPLRAMLPPRSFISLVRSYTCVVLSLATANSRIHVKSSCAGRTTCNTGRYPRICFVIVSLKVLALFFHRAPMLSDRLAYRRSPSWESHGIVGNSIFQNRHTRVEISAV
jgi:hypothetical protein